MDDQFRQMMIEKEGITFENPNAMIEYPFPLHTNNNPELASDE